VKIAYGSDLHFEFGGPRPSYEGLEDVDVLVLAGDIAKGRSGLDGNPLIIDYARSYADDLGIPIVAVAGNHELYSEEYYRFIEDCRHTADQSGPVFFLENNAVTLGNVRFLGCTLWTDFASDGDVAAGMREALIAITDYQVIGLSEFEGDEQALRPRHTAAFNAASRRFLETELAKPHDGPTVVVTHFPPVFMSAPQYAGDALSPYFNNGWDTDIENGQLSPDVWICGHTHYSTERQIGRTRILSNQAGYPGELEPFRWKIIEV
jgi:3',5'-cyclic AMP phosphodiesterase CpdA